MSKTLSIPHDPTKPNGAWVPRDYQRDVWKHLWSGGKRALEVWHRQSGKDELCLAWACVAAHQRVGNYWHMLPEAAQARKAIWDAVDVRRHLKRVDMAFPMELRKSTRHSDMFIEFRNGSTWQVIGSDNYDSLVGSQPAGIVWSEWALADPASWGYLRPMIESNDGWALFITTPRGSNHARRMFDAHSDDSAWHTSLLTPRETGLFDEVGLARIRKEYIADYGEILGLSLFEQEYLCSFEAAILGAVYGREMRQAREDGRICSVPYDPSLTVETWWDLGYRDPTSIWFVQRTKAGELRVIDYHEGTLAGLDYYAKKLQEKGYVYSDHLAPHDAAKGELGTGTTLVDQAASLGLKFTVRPITSLDSGIKATRSMISRMLFDAKRCERGIDGLTQYRYNWDQQSHILSQKPVHDWCSHPADALRTGASYEPRKHRRRPELPQVSII